MKGSNKILITLGILLFIISSTIILFTYENTTNITIITEQNKIIEQFAKNKKYEIELLSDSNKNEYIKKLEQFDYKNVDSGIEITNYKGSSEQLVIPSTINGKKVVSIAKNALDNKNIKDIILPKTILTYDAENQNHNIFCYTSSLCNNLKQKFENTTILDDSTTYDFNNAEIEFEYNIEEGIEITKYLGNKTTIIVPTTINGTQVTKISFEEEKINNKKIYIPLTVTSVNITKEENQLNSYATILGINIFSLIIYITILLIISRKLETLYNLPAIVISVIYIIIQNIYTLLNYNNSLKNILITSLIILLIYLAVLIPLIIVRKRTKEIDSKIKTAGEFIKKTNNILNDISTANMDEELSTLLKQIKEQLRYSDPVSSIYTEEIEKQIETTAIALQNKVSKETLVVLKELIIKRNNICKQNK